MKAASDPLFFPMETLKMKKWLALVLLLGTASVAQADYRCITNSNGRIFSAVREDYATARHAAIRACAADFHTLYFQCEGLVRCSTFERRGNHKPPTVGADRCFVPQTRQWVRGERFFSIVHEWAVQNRRCAVGKIATVPHSGRIYDRDGSRVARNRGGLSNSQVDDVLSSHRLHGCERFTCQERQ